MIWGVSQFPWTTLITVAGPLVAALGTVGLRDRHDLKRDQQRAEQQRHDEQAAQRQQAYTDLMTTARRVVRSLRQVRIAHTGDLLDDAGVRPVFERTDAISDDLGQAVALVEYLGSDVARERAQAIFNAAGKAGDIFSARSLALYEARRARTRLGPFDPEPASEAIAELDQAIDAFITAVRQPPTAS